MLTGEELIAGLNNERVVLTIKPAAFVIRVGGGLLQDRVGCDHLAGDQIFPDAEMLERSLGLGPPEYRARHPHLADAVGFNSEAILLYVGGCCSHHFS